MNAQHLVGELPDLLTISATHEESVVATHVDLHVSVEGDTLFSGRAALQKAQQVAALVTQIVPQHVPEEDVHVKNVRAQVKGGLLGRTSSATYELKIVCRDLERLPDVLGAVTSTKHAELTSLVWQYDEPEAAEDRRLESALRKARARAERVAAALGVRLVGVHRFREGGALLAEEMVTLFGDAAPAKGRARAAPAIDPGVEFRNERRVSASVEVDFHISRFAS